MACSERSGWLNTCFWLNRMDVEQTRRSSRGFSLPLVIQEMESQTEFAWRVKLLSCSLAVSSSERVLIFGRPRASQYRSPFEKRESNSPGILQPQNEELNVYFSY